MLLVQVTFVVVSKNHGTRLFPKDEQDSLRGNVQPGTVVDTQLVAPLRYEFVINTHAGIQVTHGGREGGREATLFNKL